MRIEGPLSMSLSLYERHSLFILLENMISRQRRRCLTLQPIPPGSIGENRDIELKKGADFALPGINGESISLAREFSFY